MKVETEPAVQYDVYHSDSEIFKQWKEEVNAEWDLARYLYINLLIVQSKKVAGKVSKKTWETIELQMLRV